MPSVDPEQHQSYFQELLQPLHDAGWQDRPQTQAPAEAESADGPVLRQLLVRSCMAFEMVYYPEKDSLLFEPVPERTHADGSLVGTFSVPPRTEGIRGVSHGPILPFFVERLAGKLGLLDPIRVRLSERSSPSLSAFMDQVYSEFVGGEAVAWQGKHLRRTLKTQQKGEQIADTYLAALRSFAPNVLPDPVPMSAAIGLTWDCWRHTPVETAHSAQVELNDVVMAKLNIMTTRQLRRCITDRGVHWPAVTDCLTDQYRELPDGRSVGQLVGEHWPDIRAAVDKKLTTWQQIEAFIGPQATLRLLSLAGSTPHTANWWGNGWWPKLVQRAVRNLERYEIEIPASYQRAGDYEFVAGNLESDLIEGPEHLPDEVLAVCIDPPEGQGLRFGKIEVPTYELTVRA